MSTEITDVRSGLYALARNERDVAGRTIKRGVMLLILLPVVAVAMVVLDGLASSFGPTLIALLYAVIAGPTGVVMTSLGVLQLRSATKKLAALDRETLPEARLLR